MSDALIREVHEDLQRDRAIALAKRYGGLVVALALAAIVGTAGYVGWNQWQQGVQAQESAALLAAAGKQDQEQADAARADLLAVAQESSDGVAAVARLQAAQAAGRAGETDQVAEILRPVREETDDAILKQVALLASVGRRLETDDPAALVAELGAMTSAENPFRHLAREYLALAKLRAGDREGAKVTLDDALKDPGLPGGARSRLAELRAAMETVT